MAADSGRIDSLAVSPAYALDQTIFAGASAGLYVSEDGGDSWQIVPGYEDTGISSLAISPGWPGHAVLLVGTSTGVYRLLTADFNVGETRQATQGLMILPSTVLALAPDETLLLAGTSGHGVYGSSDGGGSWQPTGRAGARLERWRFRPISPWIKRFLRRQATSTPAIPAARMAGPVGKTCTAFTIGPAWLFRLIMPLTRRFCYR
ncbi:MAG: hypothetical protein M5U34_14845 [Chloroflexi bacterium]|nr:hypothetical protein [Chloroflexota bacterium]